MGIIAMMCAFHAALSSKYHEELPVMLCFPLIEIILMEATFGALAAAAATVLYPKELVHEVYAVTASAIFLLLLSYLAWAASVVRSSCLESGSAISFVHTMSQQKKQQEDHQDSSTGTTYIEQLDIAAVVMARTKPTDERDSHVSKVDGAVAEDAAPDPKDKGANTTDAMPSKIPETTVIQGLWGGGKAEQEAKLLFLQLEVHPLLSVAACMN